MITFVQAYSQHTDKDVRFVKELRSGESFSRSVTSLTSDYDVKYYRLDLRVDNPAVRYIRGSVTTYFKPLGGAFNTINFNLRHDMTVDSVKYHNAHVPSFLFSSSTVLQINLPTLIPINTIDSITVFYKGVPYNDGFGSFGLGNTNCPGSNTAVMWTLSEPYGAKNWWPC